VSAPALDPSVPDDLRLLDVLPPGDRRATRECHRHRRRDREAQSPPGRARTRCHADRLELNVEDGTPLFCTTGVPAGPRKHRGLEGFGGAQNEEVFSLAARLGEDGLSEADQRRISDRVDEIAATLPPVEDERMLPGPTGVRRLMLGLAMLGAAGIWYLVQR